MKKKSYIAPMTWMVTMQPVTILAGTNIQSNAAIIEDTSSQQKDKKQLTVTTGTADGSGWELEAKDNGSWDAWEE